MTKSLCHLLLAGMLVLLPLAVSAQENEAAFDTVNSALLQGTGHAAIIKSLTEGPHNMSLSEATVFAMVSGGEANRVAFVEAGVKSASNLPQAQSVVYAVRAAAGETSAEASAADAALKQYVKTMPQPNVYEDNYTPTGGGVSPAS